MKPEQTIDQEKAMRKTAGCDQSRVAVPYWRCQTPTITSSRGDHSGITDKLQ